MFQKITRRFNTEIGHFKALTPNVRLILLSYSFFLAANPLLYIFINAYLWRSTNNNLWAIVAYNTGQVVGLPLGFYFNGALLKKVHVKTLYLAGTVLQGLTAFLVVIVPTTTNSYISLLGLLFGIGAGLYWANKNYLSLQLTKNSNRIYYNSLEQSVDLLINLVVPAATGWFIVFGENVINLSLSSTYKIVMGISFVLLSISGLFVKLSKIEDVDVSHLLLKNPSRDWQFIRLFNFIYNTGIGLSLIISSVLVLVLVGGEGVLGTLQTLTTLVAAFFAYAIGRKSKTSSAWKLVGVGSLIFLGGALFLAGLFNWVGGLIYSLVTTLVWSIQWGPSYTVEMEMMDKEETNPLKQYSYVCDNELYFNVGRIVGILIVSLLALVYNNQTSLRWSPLIIAVFQLPMAWIVFMLAKKIKNDKTIKTEVVTSTDKDEFSI